MGHWKGHFISFEMSIKWTLYLNSSKRYATFSKRTCAEKMRFLTILDVCCQKSSGRKAVKFGRNAYLNWDYNLTKKSFNSDGVRLWLVLIWHGMNSLQIWLRDFTISAKLQNFIPVLPYTLTCTVESQLSDFRSSNISFYLTCHVGTLRFINSHSEGLNSIKTTLAYATAIDILLLRSKYPLLICF
jgi:hypothetical protein